MSIKVDHLLTFSPTLSLKNYMVLSLILLLFLWESNTACREFIKSIASLVQRGHSNKTADAKLYCKLSWWDNRLGTATIKLNQKYSAHKIFFVHLKMTSSTSCTCFGHKQVVSKFSWLPLFMKTTTNAIIIPSKL